MRGADMRGLVRNKRAFWVATYLEDGEPIIDEYGNETGEFSPIYSRPVQYFGNISPAKGETKSQQFGDSLEYDRIIVMDNPQVKIDEYSRLWVDVSPANGKPNDYIVKAVARSLNSVSIAIKRVTVK